MNTLCQSNQEHLTNCTNDECERCDHLLEFYMACDECGHWGHMDSDGWFRGAEDNDGAHMVYCSEECRAKAEPIAA